MLFFHKNKNYILSIMKNLSAHFVFSGRIVKLILIGVFALIIILLSSCSKDLLPTAVPTIPAVETAEVTNPTETTATVGGNVSSDGDALVQERGVCWSLSSNPTISDNKLSFGVGMGPFTGTIAGLIPGTNYNARAYARNSVGVAYGNNVSFMTIAEVYIITATTDGKGTLASYAGKATKGSIIDFLINWVPGRKSDYVNINGNNIPLGSSKYSLLVTGKMDVYFSSKVDWAYVISSTKWRNDSSHIYERANIYDPSTPYVWKTQMNSHQDIITFFPNGDSLHLQDGKEWGTDDWSLDDTKTPMVFVWEGTWNIEFQGSTMVIAKDNYKYFLNPIPQ